MSGRLRRTPKSKELEIRSRAGRERETELGQREWEGIQSANAQVRSSTRVRNNLGMWLCPLLGRAGQTEKQHNG